MGQIVHNVHNVDWPISVKITASELLPQEEYFVVKPSYQRLFLFKDYDYETIGYNMENNDEKYMKFM